MSAHGIARTSLHGANLASALPATFELVLTEDLPNGAYGEFGEGGAKLFMPPKCTYAKVTEVLLASWQQSRGTMMNMQIAAPLSKGRYSEEWTLSEIKFKGGRVQPDSVAAEGTHSAMMQVAQALEASQPCCVIS